MGQEGLCIKLVNNDDTIANVLVTVTVGVMANEKINRPDLVVDPVYFLVVLARCSTRSYIGEAKVDLLT